MVFHIKLYACLRSFQTPFLSLFQGRASGNLQLLKELIHSVALLIHQMHTLQIFIEGLPVQGDGTPETGTGPGFLFYRQWWLMSTGSEDPETQSTVLALHEPPRRYVKMWSARFPFVRWRLSFTLRRKIGVCGECLDSQTVYVKPRFIHSRCKHSCFSACIMFD